MERPARLIRLRLMLVGLILVLGAVVLLCAGLEPFWLGRPLARQERLAAPETAAPSDSDSAGTNPPGAPLALSDPPFSRAEEAAPAVPPPGAVAKDEDTPQARARRRMVESDLRGRDISDARVLQVMGRVPRHRFVSDDLQEAAYADHPLPIGHGQTISQPYIVALMTQLVRPKSTDRALDIGTGSGYQAAVLAELCKEVYSIEILKPLAESAGKRLKELGYKNVTVRCGDGYQGWKEKAPFGVIIVAAAPDHVPKPLTEQLAPGGRLVIPVGRFYQELLLLEKQADGTVRQQTSIPVRFVPMTGEAQEREKPD